MKIPANQVRDNPKNRQGRPISLLTGSNWKHSCISHCRSSIVRISEDNLLDAQPYLDREGKLNAYGYYYFPATGGQTSVNVCLEDIELSPDWAEHITA